MIRAAELSVPPRSETHFTVASAEELPFANGDFDLVIATTSFDHCADQRAGLKECARVLGAGGRLVIVDLFAEWFKVAGPAGARQPIEHGTDLSRHFLTRGSS
jgi:ubiquinone/menaquinone biosynthesis C-methylase UbiE